MYTKYDALSDIFLIENVREKLGRKKFLTYSIEYNNILNILSKDRYVLSDELGVTPSTAVSLVRYLFPDKPNNNSKVCGYLLIKYGYKQCSKCKEVQPLENFSKNTSKASGYNTFCKSCYTEHTRDYQREYQRTRKALKLSRVPSWADSEKIKEIYANCPEGYHVDHIVPLQGELVSGLHVETNLQYLPALENLSKGNKFIV
jgi:hypothetical protein